MIRIQSRAGAKSAGETHYFTGKPCKYGHLSKRLASTGNCCQCNAENAEYRKMHYEKNKEALLARQRERYLEKRDEIREQKKKYRTVNAEKIASQKRAWYLKNKEYVSHKGKKYRESNREIIKLKAPDRYAIKKSRRINDPIYSVTERVRCLIRACIRSRGLKKSKSTEVILGCSIAEFIRHIERQFANGMGWHNASEWHIDHIVPVSSAKTERDVYLLNRFTNLRPCWAEDNLRKSNSAVFLI